MSLAQQIHHKPLKTVYTTLLFKSTYSLTNEEKLSTTSLSETTLSDLTEGTVTLESISATLNELNAALDTHVKKLKKFKVANMLIYILFLILLLPTLGLAAIFLVPIGKGIRIWKSKSSSKHIEQVLKPEIEKIVKKENAKLSLFRLEYLIRYNYQILEIVDSSGHHWENYLEVDVVFVSHSFPSRHGEVQAIDACATP